MIIVIPLLIFKRTRPKPLSCDVWTLISFGMGMSLPVYLKLKWNSKPVDLEVLASALKFHTSALSRFPYLLGGLVAIYTGKAGPLLAGKPVW